eukprot:jgi/Astpho2/9980/Aster-06791
MAETEAQEHDATLLSVLENTDLKWIFVGGKGGVDVPGALAAQSALSQLRHIGPNIAGKTTTSCSLAVQLAAVRRNVLVISTDPAHNLSDAFSQKFTKHPALVEGFTNLYAMEIDPTPEEGDTDGLGGESGSFLGELAGAIPGIDEAMSFAEVMRQVQSMDYSCIVFDTAPTGHTLRLLQFPTTLQKGLQKLMSLKGAFGGIMSQVAGLMGMGNASEVQDQLLGKLETLKSVIEEVNIQFKDPNLTTFICVCIPEFLSLYETERLVQELAKFEIDSSNIVINQVIFPEEIGSSRLLRARVRMQQKYLEQYYDLYEDFHIVKLPLLEEEVRGTEAIKEFSNFLLTPYVPEARPEITDRVEQLQEQVEQLQQKCQQLQAQLDK